LSSSGITPEFSVVQLQALRQFLILKAPIGFDIVVSNFLYQDIDVYLEVSDPQLTTSGFAVLNFLARDAFLTDFRFRFSDRIQGLDVASFFADVFSYLNPNLDTVDIFSTNVNRLDSITETDSRTTSFVVGDLFWNGSNYYKVLEGFDAVGSSFFDFIGDPDLYDFQQAYNGFVSGQYLGGQVVRESGVYYRVPNNGYYTLVTQLIPLSTGVYVAGNDLENNKIYFDTNYPLFVFIPRVNIVTTENNTSLSLCQLNGTIETIPTIILGGTPSASSGYLIGSDNIIYNNLDPVVIHNVSVLTKGHRYQPQYKAGTVVETDTGFKFIYRDHTPNINLEQKPIYYRDVTPTAVVTRQSHILLEKGNNYLVNRAFSDGTNLLASEDLGIVTRDNTWYKPEEIVSKVGIEYGYRLRRAVVKYNGEIFQSLYGVNSLSSSFINYRTTS
jgi:hypothetical protein